MKRLSRLFMKRLTRDELVKIDNMWNKSLAQNEYYKMLETIEKKINKYDYINDDEYLMNGRRQNCIERINEFILKNYDICEIMWAFWEFINDEYGGFLSTNLVNETNLSIHELDRMDTNYRKKRVICLKEKDDILSLIEKIKKYINR